ncbi:pathogenesis-related thaumatin-like protein 3.5 [Mangifera indica]|uniref:pathogenesis-related thaumatin-like protein 3.5 n=1 Tax=Mangifera indica TaxID=29780 RepID=UPI001CF980C3|nr:pathogenesis-related thaumatin-like protein 3.5 [Mangifera indica]
MAFWNFNLLFILISALGTNAAVFTLQNKCNETVWPGILTGAGKPQLHNGGLTLKPGQIIRINAPTGWSGRFWARTACTFGPTGTGNCTTGDCGGVLNCAGAGGAPPASLAEFTLGSPTDFYDVSLVDGYNLPISVIPYGGTGDRCKAVKCVSDLNRECPKELQQVEKGKVVACKSACMAFNKPEFCCTGAFDSPNTCKPTEFSKIFKKSCPMAYSYAYDDLSSIFTCNGANYLIRFC